MTLRSRLRRLRASGWWKPAIARYLILDGRARHATGDLPRDDDSLLAVAAWLGRAQDATGDGGIAGRYRLAGGWTSSYPETTGYAVPTLLKLASALNDDTFRERAARSVDFLVSVQLPCGGFPGLEIADNRTNPSPFNTAQIIHGLHEWHAATGDRRVVDAIRGAARWMCDVQDDDGAWRKHWYRALACSYSAHAACWLADAGVLLGERQFLDAAGRNLRWVLAQYDPQSGWFDRSGFSEDDHRARRAHTHTIAYTLDGVLRLSEHFGADDGIAAVRTACERLLLRLERSRTLAGVLNHEWRPQCRYVCLTGNAQMASIWLRLAQTVRDPRYANAAFKAIDEVKRAQTLQHADPGIRGGIPGSSPISGDYIQYALPNWAAKFMVDALCAKREYLAGWVAGAEKTAAPPSPIDVRPAASFSSPPRVVVFTSRISPTFASLAERWQQRSFTPVLVVIEHGSASGARRLLSSARRRDDDSARLCRANGWPHVSVPTVNAPRAIAAIARAKPDLGVAAGAGILRDGVLALPRYGTLNAHMGLLPGYRGMNVAEWAALNGDPVGCSVFFLDEGIDTGPVVATRAIDTTGCRTIAELRSRVNDAQLNLLDETIRAIADDRRTPPASCQRIDEGRQFFVMHADVRPLVERALDETGV